LVTYPADPLSLRIYGDLTPFVPLSLNKERGKILKRGADAPLKHPTFLTQSKESLREAKPLDMFL
jgi:hypothetical protein